MLIDIFAHIIFVISGFYKSPFPLFLEMRSIELDGPVSSFLFFKSMQKLLYSSKQIKVSWNTSFVEGYGKVYLYVR